MLGRPPNNRCSKVFFSTILSMYPKQQELSVNKVVVTGSRGFIGRHVVDAFRARGICVLGVHRLQRADEMMPADEICLDLHDARGMDRSLPEIAPDCIIHLAGTKNRGDSVVDFHENYQVNLLNSVNLMHSCLKVPSLKRFVFVGSCDEDGFCEPPFHESLREQPANAYGLSKLATTQLFLAWHHLRDFPVVVLRPSVVYGRGQGSDMFISSLAMSLASGRPFPMTKGEQFRDFIYVDDLVEAILTAAGAAKKIEGMVMNIGSGTPVMIRDVALTVAEKSGPMHTSCYVLANCHTGQMR